MDATTQMVHRFTPAEHEAALAAGALSEAIAAFGKVFRAHEEEVRKERGDRGPVSTAASASKEQAGEAIRFFAKKAQEAIEAGASPNAWVSVAPGEAPRRALSVALEAMTDWPSEGEALAIALLRAGADASLDSPARRKKNAPSASSAANLSPFGFWDMAAARSADPERDSVEAWAARFGGAELLRLMDEAGARWEDHGGLGGFGSALTAAAHEGNAEGARFFIQKGQSPAARPALTALARAAENQSRKRGHDGSFECVKLLIEAGASVEGEIGYVRPIMCACRSGDLRIVRLLIDSGACDPSERSQYTPLAELSKIVDLALQEAKESGDGGKWSWTAQGFATAEALAAAMAAMPGTMRAERELAELNGALSASEPDGVETKPSEESASWWARVAADVAATAYRRL
jgi:hypothetical protein